MSCGDIAGGGLLGSLATPFGLAGAIPGGIIGANSGDGGGDQQMGPGFNPNQYANNGAQDVPAAQQQAFIQALQNQAAGHGAVQQLLQQQAQNNQAQNFAQAAATRGVNPALAMRNAQTANVGLQQGANQAGVAAQLGTQAQLGTTLNQNRAQDIQNSGMYNELGEQYAGLQNQKDMNSANNTQKLIGGVLGGLGAVGAAAAAASGGIVKPGQVGDNAILMEGEPKSHAGRHFKMAKGGQVPALVSPGERYLPPQEVKKVAEGKKSPMKAGEKIPGKPKVGGAVNSYANDTVKKNLSEGGIIIPRSITQGDDAESKAHAFVSAVLAHQGLKKK